MAHRVTLDDPGVIEKILKDVESRSREYWLEAVARCNNDQPYDIIVPGVPPRAPYTNQPLTLQPAPARASRAKRRTRKHQEAA